MHLNSVTLRACLKEVTVINDRPQNALNGAPIPYAGEATSDYRDRIARHQAEALERRQQALLEQSSTLNAPAVRIRTWEGLHQLAMPRDPTHRLIGVIATATGLSLEEVHHEQRQRLSPAIAS
jgi:hypothetical protein